jgi:hypothetical protein
MNSKKCTFKRAYELEGKKEIYCCDKEQYCRDFCKQHYELWQQQDFANDRYKHSSKHKFYKNEPFSL